MEKPIPVIIRLACLLIPYTILSAILLEDTQGVSIGGGGYDLSGLVYGTLLFAVTLIWLLWISIEYASSKSKIPKKTRLLLSLLGIAALITAWFITPDILC